MVYKKIIFRADGNREIGLGHLFRMIALVEMYKEDYDFIFLTKESSSINVIPKEHKLQTIPNQVTLIDEPNWIAERYPSDEYIIITDGYHFNSSYQKHVKQLGYLLMYVDDLAQEYMYADIVINHSPHIKQEDYKAESYTHFALGTDYAILRPSFLEEAKKERKVDSLDTAFICFGGADIYDLSYKSVKSLVNFDKFKEINVVLGDAYNHSKIHQIQDDRLKIHRNLSEKEMLTLMKRCNFAIAPSSTILFEIFCVKMPVISGYYVDNQKEIYNKMNENGLIIGLGDFMKVKSFWNENIVNHYQLIMNRQRIMFDGNSKKRFLNLTTRWNF